MVDYKCKTCKKIFKHSGTFKRHQNRKFPCKKILVKTEPSKSNKGPIKNELSPKLVKVHQNSPKLVNLHKTVQKNVKNNTTLPRKSNICCNYCHKTFTVKYSLYRHIGNRCKVKKQMDGEKDKIFQRLLKEMNELKKSNAKLTNNSNNNNSNNSNNSNNNSNNILSNNKINMVCFGHENMEKLGEETIMKILNKGFMSIPYLTKMIHFNNNLPEFQNIYIANMRDAYVMVYEDDDWSLGPRNPIIEQMYVEKRDFLIEQYSDLQDKLPENTVKKFNRFLELHDDINLKSEKKQEIQLILYNKRDIPINTRKNIIKDKKLNF